MILQNGKAFPSIVLNLKGADVNLSTDLCRNAGVLIGLPGAFDRHPGEPILLAWKSAAKALKKEGLNFLGCLVVNDPLVLKGWARRLNIKKELVFLSDADGILTESLGLAADDATQAKYGGNVRRCKPFGVFLSGGVVKLSGFDDELQGPKFLASVMCCLRMANIGPRLHELYGEEAMRNASVLIDPTTSLFPFNLRLTEKRKSGDPPFGAIWFQGYEKFGQSSSYGVSIRGDGRVEITADEMGRIAEKVGEDGSEEGRLPWFEGIKLILDFRKNVITQNHMEPNWDILTCEAFAAVLHQRDLQYMAVVFPLRKGGRDALLANLLMNVRQTLTSVGDVSAGHNPPPFRHNFQLPRSHLLDADIGLDLRHFIYQDLKFFKLKYSMSYFGLNDQLGTW